MLSLLQKVKDRNKGGEKTQRKIKRIFKKAF